MLILQGAVQRAYAKQDETVSIEQGWAFYDAVDGDNLKAKWSEYAALMGTGKPGRTAPICGDGSTLSWRRTLARGLILCKSVSNRVAR
jgi:hypothetical protein